MTSEHVSLRYYVRLARGDIGFSAAHFITFAGQCERLHGHNYQVAAEVHGPLDANHYVVDFVALADLLRQLLAEWDHRVLLPTRHPEIRVAADDKEVTAVFRDRRWVFPRGDCALLPVANTTAEILARHLASLLADRLQDRLGLRPERLVVEVHESPGQMGVCDLSRSESSVP